MAVTVALLAALAVAAPANAGPPYTGDTSIPGSQPAGATLLVDVVVFSEGPVVPYEIAIQNECQLPNRGARTVQRDDIVELDLAYAITIHKSQGSEFSTVIIPVLNQHFKMLYRNLIYTGLTRARRLAVFVGTRKALAMAIRQQDPLQRQTALEELLGAGSVVDG